MTRDQRERRKSISSNSQKRTTGICFIDPETVMSGEMTESVIQSLELVDGNQYFVACGALQVQVSQRFDFFILPVLINYVLERENWQHHFRAEIKLFSPNLYYFAQSNSEKAET
ncbi:hypothetical protein Ahia01_000868200 [Argonauta hians]